MTHTPNHTHARAWRRFDAATARIDQYVAEAERKVRADAAASGRDSDAAVEAAHLRGPEPSPPDTVVLAKANSLPEIYAKARLSIDIVKTDVMEVLIWHGIGREGDSAGRGGAEGGGGGGGGGEAVSGGREGSVREWIAGSFSGRSKPKAREYRGPGIKGIIRASEKTRVDYKVRGWDRIQYQPPSQHRRRGNLLPPPPPFPFSCSLPPSPISRPYRVIVVT